MPESATISSTQYVRLYAAFADAKEQAVYTFVRELVDRRSVADATYKTALDQIGEEQLTELVHTVAYYSALATMLNAFAVIPPKGMKSLAGLMAAISSISSRRSSAARRRRAR